MTKDTIVAILETEGFKGSNKGFELPEGREIDCFIRSSADLLTVGKVHRIGLPETFVVLENRKGERFFFAYEDVVGFKLGSDEGSKVRPAAGFFR
ncbi:MAG: hypothetical protein KA712_21665 [Myxococcales bacterium]|nr:hypothetical protein [Myxococcales bacterium]